MDVAAKQAVINVRKTICYPQEEKKMLIIGEKINSTLKAIRPAIEAYDEATIKQVAKDQFEAGAHIIDINAGTFVDDEPERMAWLAKTVQSVVDAPLAVDSPSAKAMRAGLEANDKKHKPIINSITDESERYKEVAPLIVEFKAAVVGLCMNDEGMPETADDRFKIADSLINKLTKDGVPIEDIYIDPLVRPISTGDHYGHVAIDTIREVKKKYPGVRIACGLSNISFQLPARKLINQAFLVAAVGAGMDGTIIDPLDKKLMAMLYASIALFGRDPFCKNYLKKFRAGEIEV